MNENVGSYQLLNGDVIPLVGGTVFKMDTAKTEAAIDRLTAKMRTLEDAINRVSSALGRLHWHGSGPPPGFTGGWGAGGAGGFGGAGGAGG